MSLPDATALIYGVTGYIGRLCARRAQESGLRPVLAARDQHQLAALGRELDLPTRAFALDDPAAVESGLRGVDVALNCAGPFDRTSDALVDACLRTGTHYVDLAGEVPEFETVAARDAEARRAGVMLLPGAGFGVVPTDCLAAHLHARLPEATHLELAFQTVGGLSRGTARTLVRDLHRTGVRRQDGRFVPQRAAARRRRIDFGQGPVVAAINPWRADLFTAARSTGIPSIDVYTALPAPVRGLMRLAPRCPALFAARPWQAGTDALIRRLPTGPTDRQLHAGSTRVWARVTAPGDRRVAATLRGPEAYEFTARTARLILQRVLGGAVTPGFQTPATAYGPDLVLDVSGVVRTDAPT
ncbi:MAG: saccharopine dehydrogenase NADP-binding domain-containing protein, partial [Pseudonocardia sp.]|nr:saccharopine dehydrogenase NADP-binding domain-containing protein [Pseudonocardia sp.]